MRKTICFVAALAIVPAGIALAGSSGLKVTGGGQVVAGGGNGGGPGDTIAFNAQQTSTTANGDGAFPARGQLQVTKHVAGQEATKFHGTVTCIRSFTSQNNGTFVRFGGYNSAGTPFTVDAQDNGEPNQGADMIYFRTRDSGQDPCDTSGESSQLQDTSLSRGNVQTH